jgi:hypothetical protein
MTSMTQVAGGARRLKHRGFLIRKSLRRRRRTLRVRVESSLARWYRRARPYRYRVERYSGSFLEAGRVPAAPAATRAAAVPRRIFCLWTGRNPMPEVRRGSLAGIRSLHPEEEVLLVTGDELHTWLVPGRPLHPAYEHLSLVHKADYLRCYLMHFHGGGYCDIKPLARSWTPAFERLDSAPDAWVLGFAELSSDMVAQLPGRLGRDLRWAFPQVVGTSAFIFRPDTPLTREWYTELLRRMDSYATALAGAPGDERGDNPGYPITWTGLLGDILQPLCLKYVDRLLIDESIRPSFHDYR